MLRHPQGSYDAGYFYKCEFSEEEDEVAEDEEKVVEETPPLLALELQDSHDVPVTCMTFRCVCRAGGMVHKVVHL